jgi:lipoprotein NlpI
MRYRNLVTSLAACFLILGVGCSDDASLAESQDQNQQQESAHQLLLQASKAFSSGDYEQALAKSRKICEMEPDNKSYQMFRGEVCFAAGKMDECIAAYDNVIRLEPSVEPQLWQRGLALYYANRFDEGVKQFETHQTVNSQDVENAVWHLLCAARVSDIDQAREKLIPITGDTRVPMSQIYEMYAGRMTPEKVLERAEKTEAKFQPGPNPKKLQLYYAHLYIGLYHEMLKDPVAAKASLKKAAEISPLGKRNFMGQVARVHLLLREEDKPEE